MTTNIDVKFAFALRTFKTAVTAVLMTSLLSCGGSEKTLTDAAPSPVPSPSPSPSPAPSSTPAALTKFWDTYGGKNTFPPKYVELITKLMEAEDLVVAKDFRAARTIVEDLIKNNPLMDDKTLDGTTEWEINYYKVQAKNPWPHFGEPGLYAHLRMLDEITKVGVSKPMLGKTSIQMAIVMPACTDIAPEQGPTLLNQRLNAEIDAKDYSVVRQSLRLFQSYVLAISGGELSLELNFYKVNTDKCFQIKKDTDYLGGNFSEPLLQLPKGVAEKTDMFWLIYPNDISKGARIGYSSGIVIFGGQKPVFLSEDDWIIKKRAPLQGVGPRTEIERRVYMSEWFQHEFFHHLFLSWPEFKLEGDKNHEWFDRNYWQKDFVGKIEEDYYSEALNKRLYKATPSIAKKLQRANK